MTSTTILSNPIYKLSGESEKVCPIAIQASINEDLEKRRRLLDNKGESQRKVIAHEVSHIVDASGTIILQSTPYVEKTVVTVGPIEAGIALVDSAASATKGAAAAVAGTGIALAQGAAQATKGAAFAAYGAADTAAHVAIDATNTAAHAAMDVTNSAAHAAIDATNTVAHAAIDATNSAAHSARVVADTAIHAGATAATKTASFFSKAASFVGSVVSSAALGTVHAAGKVVDKTADAAATVGQATLGLADAAANKAHEFADNISSMASLVTLIAAEEKERARRLVDGDEAFAVINAMRVAALIRGLGVAFYKQETPNLAYGTQLLEEMERKWRLTSPYAALAATNAHAVGKLFTAETALPHLIPRAQLVLAHIRNIEDKERTRRMNSTDEVYAMLNAFATRDLIRGLGYEFYRQEGAFSRSHRSYAATLLEENERRYRIRTEKLLHSESAHHLADTVREGVAQLSFTTQHAAQAINDFVGKLGSATKQVATTFSAKGKELAQTTVHRAQDLATDVTSFAARMYVLALEEKERVRRMSDIDEVYAIQNAWAVSALIRDLECLYRPSRVYAYPTKLVEELERAWRIAAHTKETKARAQLVAALVRANLGKFEAVSARQALIVERAAHSRLNPNAAPFVPHSVPLVKAEPAPIARASVASRAQL